MQEQARADANRSALARSVKVCGRALPGQDRASQGLWEFGTARWPNLAHATDRPCVQKKYVPVPVGDLPRHLCVPAVPCFEQATDEFSSGKNTIKRYNLVIW